MSRLRANYRGMPAAKYNARSVTVVEGAIPTHSKRHEAEGISDE